MYLLVKTASAARFRFAASRRQAPTKMNSSTHAFCPKKVSTYLRANIRKQTSQMLQKGAVDI